MNRPLLGRYCPAHGFGDLIREDVDFYCFGCELADFGSVQEKEYGKNALSACCFAVFQSIITHPDE